MPEVAKVLYNNAFCSLFWATFSAHVATLQSVLQTCQRGYLNFNVCSSTRRFLTIPYSKRTPTATCQSSFGRVTVTSQSRDTTAQQPALPHAVQCSMLANEAAPWSAYASILRTSMAFPPMLCLMTYTLYDGLPHTMARAGQTVMDIICTLSRCVTPHTNHQHSLVKTFSAIHRYSQNTW